MIYLGIFRGGQAVAVHGSGTKPARDFALAVSSTANQAKMSFTCEQMGAHEVTLPSGDMIVAVTELARPRRKVFELLGKIEQKLSAHQAPQQALDSAVTEFSWDDPIASTQAQIDEVRTIMIENVDKLLERGERIGLLVDRTQELSTEAYSFRKQATHTRVRFWWKNVRMLMLLVALLAGITFIIYLLI